MKWLVSSALDDCHNSCIPINLFAPKIIEMSLPLHFHEEYSVFQFHYNFVLIHNKPLYVNQ